MLKSITETLKKINIDLKGSPIYSIFATFLIIYIFLGYKMIDSPFYNTAKAIDYQKSSIDYNNQTNTDQKHFIYASSKGKKYYYYDCKANIKESNKIYFESDEAAQKAGYTLSKTCK